MKHYLIFRVLVAVLGFFLVTFYLACLPAETRDATSFYLYSLLAVYMVVAVTSLLTFRYWRSLRRLYKQQVTIDFGLQAMLIWSTGGVVSIFSPLLFVTLAAATVIASPRGSFVLATLATTLLAGTTLAFSLGLVPATSTWSTWIFSGENSTFIASYLLASVFGLYVISGLGSKLSYGLRHAEHLQEEIIENMVEGLLAVDREGRIVHLNGEARKLLGLPGAGESYRHETLKETLVSEGKADRGDDQARRQVVEAFAGGKRRRFETRLVDANGRVRPVEVKVSSVRDDKDRLRCRVGLFSDLSLKREVEAFERRIQKLEELQLMAMGIAHEIRNPLASIRGCVQEIARLSADRLAQCEFSHIVMRESDRLDRIIEDFLHYARSAPADLVPVDLVAVIDEAVVLLRKRSDLHSRTLEWRNPRREIRVYGDRDRLLQVFLNLGINAVQATSREHGRIVITVEDKPLLALDQHRWDGNEDKSVPGVEVTVWDNGEGISGTHARKVLTPFFTTKNTGTGLGLSIVDRIVREHMGTIDVAADPREGTGIRVRLPRLSNARLAGDEEEKDPASIPVGEVTCNVCDGA